jgi:shikimate kinase
MPKTPIRHVFLTGFMGSGKSTIGRRLAAALNWEFVDLDERVEAHCALSIRQIFERHGEEWFRQQEHEALVGISTATPTVVAVGGGAVVREENRKVMASRGLTVWLDVPFETVIERLPEDERRHRPLFASKAAARTLYEQRRPAYRRAEVRIEIASTETPRTVAAKIERLVRQRQCAT